jgi:hypothetical protein
LGSGFLLIAPVGQLMPLCLINRIKSIFEIAVVVAVII